MNTTLTSLLVALLVICLGYAPSLATRRSCVHNVKNTRTVPHFRFYRNKCYAFIFGKDRTSWNRAKEKCESFSNGILAMPKDKATNDFLARMMIKTKEQTWIGLHEDISVSGRPRFYWLDGSSTRWFQNFGAGELDSHGNRMKSDESCVALDNKGAWHDHMCKIFSFNDPNQRPFICEWSS